MVSGDNEITQFLDTQDFELLADVPAANLLRCVYDRDDFLDVYAQLKSKGMIKDIEVFSFLYRGHKNLFTSDPRGQQLLSTMYQLGSDGSLNITDPNVIYHLSYDVYLPFIKAVLEAGGVLDKDLLLAEVFDGEKQEYQLFDYLMDTRAYSERGMALAAGALVYNELHECEQGAKALARLFSAGLNLAWQYDPDSELGEWGNLLVLLLCFAPETLSGIELPVLNTDVFAEVDWAFVSSETPWRTEHLAAFKALMQAGVVIPLDDIAEHSDAGAFNQRLLALGPKF